MSQNTGLLVLVIAIALYLLYLQSKGRLMTSLGSLLGTTFGQQALIGGAQGVLTNAPSLGDIQPLSPIATITQQLGTGALGGGASGN